MTTDSFDPADPEMHRRGASRRPVVRLRNDWDDGVPIVFDAEIIEASDDGEPTDGCASCEELYVGPDDGPAPICSLCAEHAFVAVDS